MPTNAPLISRDCATLKRAAPFTICAARAAVNRDAFKRELSVNFGGGVAIVRNPFKCEPSVNFETFGQRNNAPYSPGYGANLPSWLGFRASSFPRTAHHFTQRGNWRERTVFEAGEFELYLDGLADAAPRFGVATRRLGLCHGSP